MDKIGQHIPTCFAFGLKIVGSPQDPSDLHNKRPPLVTPILHNTVTELDFHYNRICAVLFVVNIKCVLFEPYL